MTQTLDFSIFTGNQEIQEMIMKDSKTVELKAHPIIISIFYNKMFFFVLFG